MARKTKLTSDTQERFLAAVRKGATYDLACKYAGIGVSTFYDWLRYADDEDREDRAKFSAFSEAVKVAEGEAAFSWLSRIEDAASAGNWQAAAWKLERRYPDAYGRRLAVAATQDARIEFVWSDDETLDGDANEDD